MLSASKPSGTAPTCSDRGKDEGSHKGEDEGSCKSTDKDSGEVEGRGLLCWDVKGRSMLCSDVEGEVSDKDTGKDSCNGEAKGSGQSKSDKGKHKAYGKSKDKESHDDQGTNNGKRKGSVLGKEKKGSDKDKSKKCTYSVLGGVHAIVFSGMLTGFYGVDCEDPNNINAIKLKILNITGWSSEKMISLRFNGTVVCRYGGFTCHHYNVKKEAELDLAVGG
jgi:hypothetical protein